MFNPMTSPDTGSATSSPASAAGPSQPDLLGGPTIENCGPAPRRASRSPSRVNEKPRLTIGTCGPTFSGSLVPAGPLSSWESRLRRRLARTGSTECSLIWKESATPAGRPLSRLVPSTRPTDGTASGLWPTPTASLADKGVRSTTGAIREAARNHGPDLAAVTAAALWATPTSLAPARNGNNEAGNSAGLVSIRAHALAALWQTPVADDSVIRIAGKFNSRGEPKLSAEVKLANWPTPTATDAARGTLPPRPQDTGVPLNQAVALAIGMEPNGSSATTEKPGALNPAFVCWLMGFPLEWDAFAPTAMPSSRKSRPK